MGRWVFLFFFFSFSPKALIRSNMSCQIRRLINQWREQSSPLTDGGKEGCCWRPFLSALLLPNLLLYRQSDAVTPVAKHRSVYRSSKMLFTCVWAQCSSSSGEKKITQVFMALIFSFFFFLSLVFQDKSNISVVSLWLHWWWQGCDCDLEKFFFFYFNFSQTHLCTFCSFLWIKSKIIN